MTAPPGDDEDLDELLEDVRRRVQRSDRRRPSGYDPDHDAPDRHDGADVSWQARPTRSAGVGSFLMLVFAVFASALSTAVVAVYLCKNDLLDSSPWAGQLRAFIDRSIGREEVPVAFHSVELRDFRTVVRRDGENLSYEITGTIHNATDRGYALPPLVAELRDKEGRTVTRWRLSADKPVLFAGSSTSFRTSIAVPQEPDSGAEVEFRFAEPLIPLETQPESSSE